MKLSGPFSQVVTMSVIPLKGKVKDEQLQVLENAGILTENGEILKIGKYSDLKTEFPNAEWDEVEGKKVALPGFIDSHTHICFGGKRSKDFAMRLDGKTYLEIAESGGGILSTVTNTRKETEQDLVKSTLEKANHLFSNGITTLEIKSGYALNVEGELKMLRAINDVKSQIQADVFPTFLGAHMKPRDFDGTNSEYLDLLVQEVLPLIQSEKLAKRVDIFTEQSAFTVDESRVYLQKVKEKGFEITIHADQFTPGGSRLAVEVGAVSADHLEFSGEEEIKLLANSDVVAVALPGASIGLGMLYTPARKLLDAGACLSIASDWNPGSAPMGDLLTQASILATFEKLSMAEVLSGLTFRAAKALNLTDRGSLEIGKKADFISFPTDDFRDIIYYQGQLKADGVWKNGNRIHFK